MLVTTFGEIMLRLTAPGNQKFTQSDWFNANYGGAEANVAVSLALLGDQVSFVTKLPKNDLGIAATQQLKGFGVNTSQIVRGGDRLGLYFLQRGAGPRSSNVIYDRASSAFASSTQRDYDWTKLLESTDYFYASGITPALSNDLQTILLSTAKYCHDHDIKVVYDANFRGKLWTAAQAAVFNKQMLPFVDILLVHDEDLESIFGDQTLTHGAHQVIDQRESFKESIQRLTSRYPNIKLVASILRNIHSSQDSQWQALLLTNDHFYESPTYQINNLAEVAAGDAFGAAIVHGILSNFDPQFQINYAIAAAVLKVTIPGDFNLSTDIDIRNTMNTQNNSIER